MRTAFLTCMLAAAVLIGCNQQQGPQTTDVAPGPGSDLQPLEPPGGDTAAYPPGDPMGSDFPAEPVNVSPPTPMGAEPAPAATGAGRAGDQPIVARPVQPQPTNTYTVQRGDTLWRIAVKTYGDGQRWRDILAANPGIKPTDLRVGQKLILPE